MEFAELFGEEFSEVLLAEGVSEELLLSEIISSGRFCEAGLSSGGTMLKNNFKASLPGINDREISFLEK